MPKRAPNQNQNFFFSYYEANQEDNSAVRHVFSVSVDTKETKCISCDVKTSLQDSKCLHSSAKFSKDFSYYVLNCAGPGVPEITLYDADGVKIETWENNKILVEMLRGKALPETKRFTFEVADGFQAQVSLKLPPNLNTSVKYPMLVNV